MLLRYYNILMFDTKLQVPISSKVLKTAQEKAKAYGFSSVNEIVRFMLNQFNKGSLGISLNYDEDLKVSDEFAYMLRKDLAETLKDIEAGKSKSYNSAVDLIDDLETQIENEKNLRK